MKRISFILIVGILTVFNCGSLLSQAKIKLGSEEIAENQTFTVSIIVENDRIKSYDEFPKIEGFVTRGTSSSSSTQIINGKVSSNHSISMTYVPTQQGVFILKPFQMRVNGDKLESKGVTIKVGPPVQRRSADPNRSPFSRDPFEDIFGKKDQPEFIDVKEEAFLSLSVDKNEVYIGEGVTADLSFYVSDDNRAILQFYELGRQLSEMLKVVRPSNCWEENFNIENINGEPITLNGKRYTQYKIYEATFFPFNNEPIEFPSVGLEMIKYKVAKNPSFFGSNRKEDFKEFYSRKRVITVKELPPHPLRDLVAVGDYKLNETLSNEKLETGQSFSYDFNIYGEGNISSIERPNVPLNKKFDFYDPNISQKINRKNRRVAGSKKFSYYGIPNEPGAYYLGDYFKWIFFNPKKEVYDTLHANYYVSVHGESKKNETIQSTDLGSFYDKIEFKDNNLSKAGSNEWVKLTANIFILLALVLSAAIIFKK